METTPIGVNTLHSIDVVNGELSLHIQWERANTDPKIIKELSIDFRRRSPEAYLMGCWEHPSMDPDLYLDTAIETLMQLAEWVYEYSGMFDLSDYNVLMTDIVITLRTLILSNEQDT